MSDELVTICDSCNRPTEIVDHYDIVENSYGGGNLVSEVTEWEGSECCGTETTEWGEDEWIYEYPEIALVFGYITQEEYNRIMEELE